MAGTELSIGVSDAATGGPVAVSDALGSIDLTGLSITEDFWVTVLTTAGSADVFINTSTQGAGGKRVKEDSSTEIGLYRGGLSYPCRCRTGETATLSWTAEEIYS